MKELGSWKKARETKMKRKGRDKGTKKESKKVGD